MCVGGGASVDVPGCRANWGGAGREGCGERRAGVEEEDEAEEPGTGFRVGGARSFGADGGGGGGGMSADDAGAVVGAEREGTEDGGGGGMPEPVVDRGAIDGGDEEEMEDDR